jgi:hypothetical protein
MKSCRRANGNHIFFTGVSSNLPTFLGGIQVKAFYLTNVPPVFGKKIFTVPWTTTDAFAFPIEFFHSFFFSKGESRLWRDYLLPLEKGGGRDFWEAFSNTKLIQKI